MSWQKSPLTSSTRPAARRWGLPACQDKICWANGVHASRGLAGTHGSENGHSGVQSPLRDNEPGRVRDFDGLDRVVNLPTTIPGPASLSGERGQGGSNLRAVRLLPQDSNQTRQTEMRNSPPTMRATAGSGVIPADDPAVEVGGVIENQVERRILAGHGEGPVDETHTEQHSPAEIRIG